MQLLEEQLQLVKDGQVAAEKKAAVAEARLEGQLASTTDSKERLTALQADLQVTGQSVAKSQAEITEFRAQVQEERHIRADVERERDGLAAQVKLLNKEMQDIKNAVESQKSSGHEK